MTWFDDGGNTPPHEPPPPDPNTWRAVGVVRFAQPLGDTGIEERIGGGGPMMEFDPARDT